MRRFVVVMALALICPSAMAKQHPKLAPELTGPQNGSTVDVIVQFHKKTQTSAMTASIVSKGGQVQHDLSYIHALHTSIPASQIAELEKDAEVEYISPNRKLGTLLNNSAAAVNANYAWTLGLTGSGVGVAVMDSGIHMGNDLKPVQKGGSRVVANFDLVGGGPDDKFGHGTHVAGILAGNGAGSSCPTCDVHFRGLASGANLINFRVLDQNGQGTDASVINAINQAIALKNQYNIRVINLSLGRAVFESYTRDPLCQAVEAAWKAGIVVVVAAGNDGRDNAAGTNGYGTITAPGNDPYVITVGAMNTKGTPDRADDIMTSYSSKGPTAIDHIAKPDLVAPGNRVISLLASADATLPKQYPGNRPTLGTYETGKSADMIKLSDAYFMLSGTSMATPAVSAAAVLLIQQNPKLTPDQVKARLMKTAYKNLPPVVTIVSGTQSFTEQADIFTVGAGYLDIQAALSDSSIAPLSARSPTAVYDQVSGNVYFASDASTVWGSNVLWGSTTVWGINAFAGNQSVAGASAALGASNALWGSNALWVAMRSGAAAIQQFQCALEQLATIGRLNGAG